MTKLDNSNISVHLGQTSQYKDQYDSNLLVREPRSNNRKHLDISDDDLPFVGYDTWNAYEVSGLTNGGLPVAGVAKIVYPCDSKYIVESKSIKLYFNSFNMFKCGTSQESVLEFISLHASDDLSKLLETHVEVHVIPSNIKASGDPLFSRKGYTTLEEVLDPQLLTDMNVETYTETPDLLELEDLPEGGIVTSWSKFHSGLLKSNCRVTSQPDWGDVWIAIKGQNHVTPESMLKYIISFRDECHFHEEICETIYKRLHDILLPEKLVVTCLYARRGGIDINPVRANDQSSIDWACPALIDVKTPHVKTSKQ